MGRKGELKGVFVGIKSRCKGQRRGERKQGEWEAAFPIRQAWRIQKGKCRMKGEGVNCRKYATEMKNDKSPLRRKKNGEISELYDFFDVMFAYVKKYL